MTNSDFRTDLITLVFLVDSVSRDARPLPAPPKAKPTYGQLLRELVTTVHDVVRDDFEFVDPAREAKQVEAHRRRRLHNKRANARRQAQRKAAP